MPFYAVLFRLLGGSFLDFLKSVRQAALVSLILLAVVVAALHLIRIDAVVPHLVVLLTVSGACYIGLLYLFGLHTFILKAFKG